MRASRNPFLYLPTRPFGMVPVHCTAFTFTRCLMSIAYLGTSYSWTFDATNERVRPVWITKSTISQVDLLMILKMTGPPFGMKALATVYGLPGPFHACVVCSSHHDCNHVEAVLWLCDRISLKFVLSSLALVFYRHYLVGHSGRERIRNESELHALFRRRTGIRR
ncbi:hypothetical protein F4604DRAFT_1742725, partial [Suillus subluteus]